MIMNPFRYGTIARGDNFYDRKEEKERIINTLLGGNNVVLLAPRRYGKTSLVFRVMDELKEKGIKCIYFDMMPVYSLESFASLYMQAIEKTQTGIERFVKKVSSSLSTIRSKVMFDSQGNPEFGIDFTESRVSIGTISELLDLPEKLNSKGERTIVFFDEFQEITKFDKYGLESLLRSKIQQQNTKYLFLGSKTHILSDMFTSKKKPFYNSAFNMHLTELPIEETISFLQNKFKESNIDISGDDSLYLIKKAANIPYYIQMLAAEVWQYSICSTDVISPDIIDICTNNIVKIKHDYYFELFDKYSVMQKKLLQALSDCSENIFSSEFITKYRLSAPSTVQKAVTTLLENGTVEKTDNKYYISDPFFKLFVKEIRL